LTKDCQPILQKHSQASLQRLKDALRLRQIRFVAIALQRLDGFALPLDMGACFSQMPVCLIQRARAHRGKRPVLVKRLMMSTARCTARSVDVNGRGS